MNRSGTAMAWNVFKFCSVLRGIGSVMILLVVAIVGVSYFAVVICNYGPALIRGGMDTLVALCVLIPFHGLLVMLLWSYFTVVLTDPGGIPLNWKPITDEEIGETAPLTSIELDGPIALVSRDPADQILRHCRKCNQMKPPRCHHCSVCGSDGEIPGTPTVIATTFLAFVLNLAFALSLLGFLVMHVSLVMANTTTIEAYEKKNTPKWRYDIGRRKNFEQVFGNDSKYWFLPAYSEEDLKKMPVLQGLDYPSRPDADTQEL